MTIIKKLFKGNEFAVAALSLLVVFFVYVFLSQPVPYCLPEDPSFTPARPPTQVDVETFHGAVSEAGEADGLVMVRVIGDSMLPTIQNPSKCYCEGEDGYSVGDIIMFNVIRGNELLFVTHRIMGGSPDGFITMGDNNEYVDPWLVPQCSVFCRVPMVPRWVVLSSQWELIPGHVERP